MKCPNGVVSIGNWFLICSREKSAFAGYGGSQETWHGGCTREGRWPVRPVSRPRVRSRAIFDVTNPMQISGLRLPKAGDRHRQVSFIKRLPQRRRGNVSCAGQLHRKLQLRIDFLAPDPTSVVSVLPKKGFRPQRTHPRACAPFGSPAFAAMRSASLGYRFADCPTSWFALVPLRRCVSRCRVSVSVRRPGAPRQPRSALASVICAAPGELARLGCGTELAILPDSVPNYGLVDSRQRRWDTSPRDVAKHPKDLEGDPSPGRIESGYTFKRVVRFQTPSGSKATKSLKRHGGKGCSDATRL